MFGTFTEEEEDAYRILRAERSFNRLFLACRAQSEMIGHVLRTLFIILLIYRLDRIITWRWEYVFLPLWVNILAVYIHVDCLRCISKTLLKGIDIKRNLSRTFQDTIFSSTLGNSVKDSVSERFSMNEIYCTTPSSSNLNDKAMGENKLLIDLDNQSGYRCESGMNYVQEQQQQPSFLILQRRMRVQHAAKLMAVAVVSFFTHTLLLSAYIVVVLYLNAFQNLFNVKLLI